MFPKVGRNGVRWGVTEDDDDVLGKGGVEICVVPVGRCRSRVQKKQSVVLPNDIPAMWLGLCVWAVYEKVRTKGREVAEGIL